MKFANLNRWGDYWYLPRMNGLYVFDAVTGDKVSDWYVHDSAREWKTWSFHCCVNTLPPDRAAEFGYVVRDWEQYVDARLTECFSGREP